MKSFLIFYLLFIAACGNNNNMASKTDNSTTERGRETSTTSGLVADIVGEWEMVGFVMDTNDNLQIDDTERKELASPGFKDYMKLNSDGSGLFTVAKLEGRYEAARKDGDDKKFLTWFDKESGAHRVGTIISVSKDEMHIKEPGGDGLFVWKKL